MEFLIWCIATRYIDALQSKPVLVSDCLQKGFVCDWEMFPKVHRLMDVGLAISFTVHCKNVFALQITSTLVFTCLSI